MEFTRFSDEIYVEIMKYITNLSIRSLSRVNKKFNHITVDKLLERKQRFASMKADNILINIIRELSSDRDPNFGGWDMITLKFNLTEYDGMKDLFDTQYHSLILEGIRLSKNIDIYIYFQDYFVDACDRLLTNIYLKIGIEETKIQVFDSIDLILKFLKILIFRDVKLYKVKEDITRKVSITTLI